MANIELILSPASPTGSIVFNLGTPGPQGIPGPTGAQGAQGVVAATAPLSYNSGTQTISIDLSAYATQSWATANLYPISSNPSGFITSSALNGYATQSWVSNQGFLTFSTLSNGETTTLNATAPTVGQALTFDGEDLVWATVSGGGGTWGSITGTLSEQTDLQSALDAKYDASNPSGFIDSSSLAGYATESWVTSQGYITSVPNPSADFMMANAIASLIYIQTANSYGDLLSGNAPQFLTALGTSWGIVDGSSTYYNCTGFSGSSYGLSGTAGSGPYKVRVNGTDSAFTF